MGRRVCGLALAGAIGLGGGDLRHAEQFHPELATCHPEPSEGSSGRAVTQAGKIPRLARDDGWRARDDRWRARDDSASWARLAREIHDETNLVRRDPVGYTEHLEDMLSRFDGNLLERPGRPLLRTEEGPAAVEEAISALRLRKPVPELRWSKGLAGAAADHVKDQGPIGGLEHHGTDGSDPARRAERRGQWLSAIAENIAYGDNPAREVVIQLLVDDGVPDRGHRNNILSPGWGVGGVACGPHRDYRQICVMDYAVRYLERGSP